MNGITHVLASPWPWAALVLILVALMCIFRGAISDLIKGTKTIEKDGVKVHFSDEQTTSTQREKQKQETVQKLLSNIGNSPVIDRVQSNIIKELKDRNFDVEGDTNKVLIKHLAAAQVIINFQEIYRSLFGSQIYVMKELNARHPIGTSVEHMKQFVNHIKEKFPNLRNLDYLAYLLSYNLITEDKVENQYHITDDGREFLVWLAKNGMSENLPN